MNTIIRISKFFLSIFSVFSLYLSAMEKLPETSTNGDILQEVATVGQAACQVCHQSEKLNKCGGCQKVFYCSKDCQRKHWPIHKDTCNKMHPKTNKVASLVTDLGVISLAHTNKLVAELRTHLGGLAQFVLIGTSCLDYVICYTQGPEVMMDAKGLKKIAVGESNSGISFFSDLGFSLVNGTPEANDIIIYYQGSKAIHFGVLERNEGKLQVISKPGIMAKEIFIHDIEALYAHYGNKIKFMRKN